MKFLTPEQMEKSRKRHLCKRLRLGELQGFGSSSELTYDRSALSHNNALNRLIGLVEAQGWVFGDGGSPGRAEISGYPYLAWVDSLDEANRESARLQLGIRPWCKASEVNPLSDCWHDSFE